MYKPKLKQLSRRDFLKLSGTSLLGFVLSACGISSTPIPPNTTSTSIPPTNTATPVPPTPTITPTPIRGLEPNRGIHPRLILNVQRVEELRSSIETTHKAVWQDFTDICCYDKIPDYPPNDSDDSQAWQRPVGDVIPSFALIYLMTGNNWHFKNAKEFALASCKYPTWGLKTWNGRDLAAGHQLLGLALVYDWLYADLDNETKDIIRNTLLERGRVMFASKDDVRWWRNDAYVQNHLWISMTGLLAAGLAIYDEYPEVSDWLDFAHEKMSMTFSLLGDDGASHEGFNYWEYGVDFLLVFMELARNFLDVDLYSNEWIRQTAFYSLYLTLPRSGWKDGSNVVNFADSPREFWYRPDHILRPLAKEYKNGYAQWAADNLLNGNKGHGGKTWRSVVGYDPTVNPTPPDDLPTLYHFRDMDIVVARSDWSDNASLVAHKCGPYLGHRILSASIPIKVFEQSVGHVHPDVNHFMVFGNGEWQIRDDGYSYKWTAQHNTLLINGKGQIGEGEQWFGHINPQNLIAEPSILKVESSIDVDHIISNGAAAYPADANLKQFVRHLFFVKPNLLIVADDIIVNQPSELELRFFPEGQIAQEQSDGSYLVAGKKSVLRFQILTPNDVNIKTEPVPVIDLNNVINRMLAFQIQTQQVQWRNAVAISWSDKVETLKSVILSESESIWNFEIGQQKLELNW